MAALAAAVVAASTAFASLRISTPIPFTRPAHRHLRTVIASSLSPSSTELNVTFAPAKPVPISGTTGNSTQDLDSESASEAGEQLYIPWIGRDENGNFSLQHSPPSRLLHVMAHASTAKKTTKKKKDAKATSKLPAPSAEPKSKPRFSKAARRYYNANFRDPPKRLAKVLAAAGVASRRSCEELIFQGKVTVNGSVCDTPQTRVDPARDVIYVNGSRLPKRLPPKVYLALNKPKGYICSSGEKETKSVMSLFSDYMESWDRRRSGTPRPRLFTVGRLDVNTTGLIIVTNDGEFAHKLSHPSSNLSKEYIATIDGEVHKRHLLTISEGTVIEGLHCTPDVVELLPKQPDISRPRLRIVVHEGRHHEVRELVKNAGLQVHALKRLRIGGFRLPPDLALGKHVELTQANLRALGLKD